MKTTSVSQFLQTQNPRTKMWIKINAKTGKIISTKKTPGKYKGIKVAKLAKKAVAKKAAKPASARKGWAASFKKGDAEFKGRVNSEKARIKSLTENHLKSVASEAGKVTKADRDYCKALGERMLDHKFRDSLEKV